MVLQYSVQLTLQDPAERKNSADLHRFVKGEKHFLKNLGGAGQIFLNFVELFRHDLSFLVTRSHIEEVSDLELVFTNSLRRALNQYFPLVKFFSKSFANVILKSL